MSILLIVVRYEFQTSISGPFSFELNWFDEFSKFWYFEVKIYENPYMDVWTCYLECIDVFIGLGCRLTSISSHRRSFVCFEFDLAINGLGKNCPELKLRRLMLRE